MPIASAILHTDSAKQWVGVFAFLFLLGGPFRAGWVHAETDFPNYYTAAVLVRQAQPLRDYYDWTWFARQMNYAGNGMQLGAYAAQTPLTMLPMVGLAVFPPQKAKQIWLILNLFFLGMTVLLLSRITRFNVTDIWLLTFCGYFSLRTNFLYGQYYIFLLFLLTIAFFFLQREAYVLGGLITAAAFGLKLYGGPFLLYFLARREWKALISMIFGTLLLIALAAALFGPADVRYYAMQILPRSLEGGSIDPYNPGVPTLPTLLRRVFVNEPELNPHPLWEAPWLFFFLRTFLTLAIIGFLSLQTSLKRTSNKHDFAMFMISAVLLSTSTASYTFILLILPIVLLLEESGPMESVFLVLSYVLLTLPLHPTWLFPKAWLLISLFLVVSWSSLRRISLRTALVVTGVVSILSIVDANRHMLSYANEPAQHFAHAVVQEGAIFSSFPVISRYGLFYQSMRNDRYVLRWLHGNHNEELFFNGQSFHPRVASNGESILFELVANGTSTMMQFDPSTRKTEPSTTAVLIDPIVSIVSPDGKWMTYESSADGPVQIWIREMAGGRMRQLTGGNCNNSSPTWELDSHSIIFASDCNRAFGLPALYRSPIDDSTFK